MRLLLFTSAAFLYGRADALSLHILPSRGPSSRIARVAREFAEHSSRLTTNGRPNGFTVPSKSFGPLVAQGASRVSSGGIPRLPFGEKAAAAVRLPQRRRRAQRFALAARKFAASTFGLVAGLGLALPRAARAMGVASSSPNAAGASSAAGGASAYSGPLWVPACLWLSLFVFSAALHAAEIAITTLYPWKVCCFTLIGIVCV